MPTDLPDEWFRPSRPEGDGAGELDRLADQARSDSEEGPDHRPFSPSSSSTADGSQEATDPGARTLDPESTGRLSLGGLDDEGPSVVVGHAPRRGSHSRGHGRRGPRWPLLILGLTLALVLGLILGSLARKARSSESHISPVGNSIMAPQTTEAQPWRGSTRIVSGVSAEASCVTAPALDEMGRQVRYPAANAVDGNRSTAWRCDGEAIGQRVTLEVPSGTRLVGVGIINGYAKNSGGTDLYHEYRRVLKVRWTLPGGSWFTQDLTDGNEGVQGLKISPHVVRGPVVMTILASSSPGMPGEGTRDAILVSEIQLYTSS
ncbi:NADase-type glycan-binding domain-containing protein [Acidipropionibacterium virtanenii]|uniref:NAD glycohydrolase translocation F5/8 type C domain-containing protein n=1 Tax=Acidipropionibacterium virtanenii TaxID=2057246 RepID=A0A344URN3_9ACTN|nr:hypothetical protein [Acidipropionibacterium virtanenii]AXE37931.1 hypothetical protein JS278_00740 [Acidipropionibacterium virtanenii]